ncbi:hypothetical protein GCM10022244_09540 [Streptomyces gulbargensis]|uniref:Uncharacterized protein n=2 Tax=Streptomyces TaxID=1883 RepID=A0ABP7LGJ5_9ACTN
MTATTFTLVTALPRPRRLGTALSAVRAFGTAAAEVTLLGSYGPPEAGVRHPAPRYAPAPGPGPGSGPGPAAQEQAGRPERTRP